MPAHPMLLFSYQACLPTAVAGSLAGNLSSIELKEEREGGRETLGDIVQEDKEKGRDRSVFSWIPTLHLYHLHLTTFLL